MFYLVLIFVLLIFILFCFVAFKIFKVGLKAKSKLESNYPGKFGYSGPENSIDRDNNSINVDSTIGPDGPDF